MRVLLCVCFTAVFIFAVDGQTDPNPDPEHGKSVCVCSRKSES